MVASKKQTVRERERERQRRRKTERTKKIAALSRFLILYSNRP